MADDRWLLVIDPQVIFADPDSDWASPMWPEVEPRILRLIEAFGERTIITRWVPPKQRDGSWREYMAAWPFADVPPTDPKFGLLEPFQSAPGRRLDAATFGKWGADLISITGPHPHLVVAGVSTDCCVLSTVIPAADAGAYIELVTDACAGSTPENHAASLTCMSLYPPQVTPVTTAEICENVG
ncbi:hypothetical protein BSZ39_09590 [Bowdeniella nasicola]|uniref:Isochorismatase-like domain-containing protein n=1 Tax=Bowdeniella nasicola TaxID=208480 RepID=A0A1Q5Q0L3_9ACTO|nr:isochorismatase family cysteine hydrolase [Bowdeniella nasicola]OKL53423.1 hypothetical protein BSZ39_09590 [Bowdeniella nasicola]